MQPTLWMKKDRADRPHQIGPQLFYADTTPSFRMNAMQATT